jgi:phosphomannomutase
MKPARTLKTGISGVRGVVGDSLTPGLLVRFGEAFGTYVKGGQVAIGRDTRRSGEMVRAALIGGVLATGCDVHDFGVLPVPTLQIAVARRDYQGGIAITASHNPQEWNALKFIRGDGLFLYPYQAEELLNVYHQGEFTLVGEEEVGLVAEGEDALGAHMQAVVEATDVEAIRAAGLKVVIDCCNGAGAVLAPRLLREIGCCEVIVINGEPNGLFAHPPEPIAANLHELERAVRETGADVGFAQDADGDRLALVSEQGVAIGEEYTLALAAEVVAGRKAPIPLVTSLSTSRMIEDVGQRYGCLVRRTRVGEINVVAAMQEEAAKINAAGLTHEKNWVFGGEGNGGVIDPQIHYCRDSHRAMSLILEGLAHVDKPLSQWAAESFEPSVMVKERIECPASKVQPSVLAIKDYYADSGHVDETEGVRVTWPDRSWLHVRASNTEPIIRVVVEADSLERAKRLAAEAVRIIRRTIS